MFSWRSGSKLSLAEVLGQNTLKYREGRDAAVKLMFESFLVVIQKELEHRSTHSRIPSMEFNVANEELTKKVVGLGSLSVEERDRILTLVASKLKEEKLQVYTDGTVLKVEWPVPVPAPPTVAATPAVVAPAVASEKPETQ